mmetsp:Transcript_19618/g.44528  ORF Transcript_19618/g.44528 Transcript_19618/m.44528 type:complete len:599 (-) Transcript_19618:397-2193(-)
MGCQQSQSREETLNTVDADGDGVITEDEINKAVEAGDLSADGAKELKREHLSSGYTHAQGGLVWDEEGPEMSDDEEIEKSGGWFNFRKHKGPSNEVRLIVVSARNLKGVDPSASPFGSKSSDPFAIVEFNGRSKRTPPVFGNLNPRWKGQKFTFPLYGAHDSQKDDTPEKNIAIKIMDTDLLSGDDPMGEARLSVDELSDKYEKKRLKLKGKVKQSGHIGSSKEVDATGEVHVFAKRLYNPLRAANWKPNKPVSPKPLKFLLALILALWWLLGFLISVLNQSTSAVFEWLCGMAISAIVRIFTGYRIRLDRLSLRFGMTKNQPTEIILSGFKVFNPAGSYASPHVLYIRRLELHVHIDSYFKSSKWVKYKYLNEKKAKEKVPEKTAAFEIDLIRIDTLQLFTEKNFSPLVEDGQMFMNYKGLLGPPSEDAPEDKKEEEDAEKPPPSNGLPEEAQNLPLLFKVRTFILTGVELKISDLLADIMGDPDGCGDINKQKAVEIDSILADADDFEDKDQDKAKGKNKDKDMIWLKDLTGVIVAKIIHKIDMTALLTSVMTASGSVIGGETVGKIHSRFFGATKSVPGMSQTHANMKKTIEKED